MLRRAAQHAIIIVYLAVTAAALTYTMTRIRFPFPWTLVRFSYGMMAPFQDYMRVNEELEAEGKLMDGTWQRIDLAPYFPFLRGEANIRGYLPSFRDRGDAVLTEQYRAMAEQIMRLEEERGRSYASVRLQWVTWPLSEDGYRTENHDPLRTVDVLVEIP